MSEVNQEHLSAFVDGELEQEQIRFLLRRLDHDVELRGAWARYHLMGDGLRRQLPPLAGTHFADGVMAAIGQAPASGRRRWLQWSAGGAIAAGVAAMALMVAQPPAGPQDTTGPDAATAIADVQSVSPPAAAPVVPRWLSATPAAAQLTQPAAATFYAVGPGNGRGADALAPYMDIPHYGTSGLRPAGMPLDPHRAGDAHYARLASPAAAASAATHAQLQ
jgi:sigma-E factor negative regulatory protein RseA